MEVTFMSDKQLHKLGIDIGSTTVKIAILDSQDNILFSDYERHFANIQETLASLIAKASNELGDLSVSPVITGSGGLTLAKHLEVPFTQEVIAVSTALTHYAPQTDVAIELGGEDAKIIYFEGGNVEQRMNGICAGGTGSFIDQMASLIQTDASGLNEYAKIIKQSIRLQRAVVYLPRQISSRSSMRVQLAKICLPLFSRRLSIRRSVDLPVVNRSADMWHFSVVLCTFYPN